MESFNGTLRDELLKGGVSCTLPEAQVPIERWRREYNTIRPHRSLGDLAPSVFARLGTGRRTAARV